MLSRIGIQAVVECEVGRDESWSDACDRVAVLARGIAPDKVRAKSEKEVIDVKGFRARISVERRGIQTPVTSDVAPARNPDDQRRILPARVVSRVRWEIDIHSQV